jgi:hypothetical protein
MGEEPSQTFQQYTSSSTGVMQYLKNQLASFGLWSNIPGTLVKVSTSSKGYVWGYASNSTVWTCKEPCTDGKWQQVGFGAKPLDIATDDMYVYILHTTQKETTLPAPPPMLPMKGLPNPADLDSSIPHPPFERPKEPTTDDWRAAGFPGGGASRGRLVRGWGGFWERWKAAEIQRRNQQWEAGWATYNEAYAAKKNRELAAQPRTTTTTSTAITYKQVDKWDAAWKTVDVPFNADKITVTNGFLWASDGQKNAFCGKPCSTGNWNVRNDNHTLIGGGATHVFATQPGKTGVFKSDETAQTGWSSVKGLEGISTSTLAAEADNSVLYAADSSKVYRCTDTCDKKDNLEVINAQGFVPIQSKGSLSINPTTRNVWMASQIGSSNGNLFSRLDSPDKTPILNMVDESQKQRDRAVNSLGGDLRVSTAQISSAMAKQEAADAVKEATSLSSERKRVDNEIQTLTRKIETSTNQIAGYDKKKKPMIILLICLAVVAIMYLTVGWFMPYGLSMAIAVLVLGAGLGLAIYFSTQ